MERRYEHWIGGAARAPKRGRYVPSTNPANGEQLTQIALGDADDVAAAVSAATMLTGVEITSAQGHAMTRRTSPS